MYSTFLIHFYAFPDIYSSASGGKAEIDEDEENEKNGAGDNEGEEGEGEGEDSLLGKRKANIEAEEIDIDDV